MQIEVFEGEVRQKTETRMVITKKVWYWHFRQSNGRIVADAEEFPSKAHAVRAAKAVVKAIMKRTGWSPQFTSHESEDYFVYQWSGVK
jgi:uncharacterized protein YegP (UPF0339 family)